MNIQNPVADAEGMKKNITANYSSIPGAYDEMCSEDGSIRPHWRAFIQSIEKIGMDELERCHQEALHLLKEDGVTYNIHGEAEGLHYNWILDPVPWIIGPEDWASLESGLNQRAKLLNFILTDLYGDRKLIGEGLIPLELVYSHKGFLRPCDKIRLQGKHQLILYAADVVRGPDHRMWVLKDRTQAPVGAGYALENRTAMARVLSDLLKECNVHRLSNFFRELRTILANIAPHRKNHPRIVVLSHGPQNEAYFEHAYLAAYLGYTLVQGEDLTVRNGHVWLKSLDGLQPVDIILRYVEDYLCDPLELSSDSPFGVAGLLEAERLGNVAIANPLGSSVLENPGLMAFLPNIANFYFDEELELPSAATWWCGQEAERNYVLANLERLVIKTIHREQGARTVFGFALDKKELDMWRIRIRKNPHLYVAQEQIGFSTAPSLADGGFDPRRAALRCFLVSGKDGYAVMPGGLTRSTGDRASFTVSDLAGGITKDTWIMAQKPQQHVSLWLMPDRLEKALRSSAMPASRVAENLFWVGRYAERIEATSRLMRIIFRSIGETNRLEDETHMAFLHNLLRSLTHLTSTYPGFVGEDRKRILNQPRTELIDLILNETRTGSLASTLNCMINAAYGVRDRWSTDTWRIIENIEEHWQRLQKTSPMTNRSVKHNLDYLITALMALAGLSMENMIRDPGWLMLDIGRRIERGLSFITFFKANLVEKYETPLDHMMMESVLATTENIIAYRRRYRSYLQLETMLELLLSDETNPRSLGFQINVLQEHITQLPRDRLAHRLSPEERIVLEASTLIRLNDPAAMARVDPETHQHEALSDFLDKICDLLLKTSDTLALTFFSHTQKSRQLVSVRQDS